MRTITAADLHDGMTVEHKGSHQHFTVCNVERKEPGITTWNGIAAGTNDDYLHSFNAPDSLPLGLVSGPSPLVAAAQEAQALNQPVEVAHLYALNADELSAIADIATTTLHQQQDYVALGDLAEDLNPDEVADKIKWLRRAAAAMDRLRLPNLASLYRDLAARIDQDIIRPDAPSPAVIITVSAGMVEVVQQPDGVEVEIIDLDTLRDDEGAAELSDTARAYLAAQEPELLAQIDRARS